MNCKSCGGELEDVSLGGTTVKQCTKCGMYNTGDKDMIRKDDKLKQLKFEIFEERGMNG